MSVLLIRAGQIEPDVSEQSNSELIQAVFVQHSSIAYSVLVRRYERLVWSVAWGELQDYHTTQDVTQETFLIAHQRLT